MVGQALIAVMAIALLMFVSNEDALLVSLIVAFTGLVAIVAAQVLADGMLRDVEHVRDALFAVGEGRRDVHITTSGSDELAELADAANVMVERLAAEERARRRRGRAPGAGSGGLARPAHADHLAAPDRRCGQRRAGRRADAREIPAAHDHPPRCPGRADRRPVRALADRSGRHPLEHGPGAPRRAGAGDRRRHARGERAAGRPPRRRGARCADRAAGQPREAPARPVQPDPERDPPHPRRRQRDGPRSRGRHGCRGRSGRHWRRDRGRGAGPRVRRALSRW